MKIIGIDPGLQITGYSLIEFEPNSHNNYNLLECGAIKTSSKQPYIKRLQVLREDMYSLLNNLQPDYIAIELLYFSTNIKTAIHVAQARGVILEAISHINPQEIFEFTPTQMKQIITGNGRADKLEIQEEIKNIFSLENIIKPDDVNDAVAMAICGIRNII